MIAVKILIFEDYPIPFIPWLTSQQSKRTCFISYIRYTDGMDVWSRIRYLNKYDLQHKITLICDWLSEVIHELTRILIFTLLKYKTPKMLFYKIHGRY